MQLVAEPTPVNLGKGKIIGGHRVIGKIQDYKPFMDISFSLG